MVNFLPIVKALEITNINVRGLGQVVVDPATIMVGNNSVTARCRIDGLRGLRTIKCYIVSQDVEEIVPLSFYPKALRVYSFSGKYEYVDVAISKWIAGEVLDVVLNRGGCDYKALSMAFDRMAFKHLKRGIIHGDIKPENIILTPAGNMVLVDNEYSLKQTEGNYRAKNYGTEVYMHRHRRLRRTDESTDNYSLALLSTLFAALVYDESYLMAHGKMDEYIEVATNILKDNGDIAHYNLSLAMQRSIMGKIDNILTLMQEAVAQAQAEEL